MNPNEPEFYFNLIATGADTTTNVAPALLNKMSANINYRKLTKKLEDITGTKFPECITHFKYLSTEEDHDRNESCLCGKEHLVVLNYFKCDVDNEIYIIGSNCIRHFVLIGKNTTADNNVIRYLNNIETELDTGLRALEYNKCLSCKDLKIKKGYEYKNKLHKVFCKDCISGERVKCCDCRKLFPIGLDYQGNHKTRCMGCWKRSKGYNTIV
jgi:hypothetical protein